MMKLKALHAYFYQVQAQIKICHAMFCDFVAWNDRELFVHKELRLMIAL